jgi:ABC-type lipoprotein release transport system permease subunit
MTLIKIAWRNIWRSKLRSIVVIFAIASGLVGGLFSSAWMTGMVNQRVSEALSIESAHIQLHNTEFIDNFDVKKTILSTKNIVKNISKTPGVKAVTSRLKISGMAATANKNMGVTIIGVNPKSEKEVFKLYTKIDTLNGTFLNSNKKNTIIISKALATELKAKLKSKIVLTFQDYHGEITGAAFKVVGIFKTTNSVWDKMHVFVKENDLRKVLELPENQSHEIDILLNDFKQATAISAHLQKKYPTILIEDWTKIQPYINFITSYMNVMMGIFMLIILGALGFGIVNTMLMVVLERTREIGMLMAIGMTKKRVFSMILLETIFLALVGAFIGELISMLLINYYGKVGVDLSSVAEGLETIGYSAITYPYLEPIKYVQITILVVITGIIASIYPAIKALKLDPANAIRTI